MSVKINANIFPVVMNISIRNPENTENSEFQSIALPQEANILYLQALKNKTEIDLLKKYADNGAFSDGDYEALFKLFITNVPRLKPPTGKINDFLEQFGVDVQLVDGKFKFKLIEECLPEIKVDTWDNIAVDLLRKSYTDIINCFDFGDINIYLGSWKSESNMQKQSLLNAFRNALMYTIVGFLYGDDRKFYSSFSDYFDNEYYKRIALIHGIWKHRESEKNIEYIPMFDSFYNLHGISSTTLIQTLQAILSDNNIVQDERMMIRNRLIDGAKDFHTDNDPQRIALEQSIIKPVVNFLIELQNADENYTAARTLFEQGLYEPSINRSYYAMMHALKALLENKKQLSDWEPDKLNVGENHKQLESKLKSLAIQSIIGNKFLTDYQYVKQKRWIADYNISNFSKSECEECLNRTVTFIKEIKRITL